MGDCNHLLFLWLRQLIIILPLAMIFTSLVKKGQAGISLIWWSFLITEFITFVVGMMLLKQIKQTKVAKELGFSYYDRKLIDEVAKETGLDAEYIKSSAELAPKKGIFAYSFV